MAVLMEGLKAVLTRYPEYDRRKRNKIKERQFKWRTRSGGIDSGN